MSLKKYKPITPTQRYYTGDKFEDITKGAKREKSLLKIKKRTAGRNSKGRITSRHRGGGHKKFYREVLNKRHDKKGIEATVKSIEYDPNRTGYIALLYFADGDKRYILAPNKLKVGDIIIADDKVEIKPGNACPIGNVPLGTMVHNVELTPKKGGQLARSAGNFAEVTAKEGKYTNIKLPSGAIQKIRKECYATIGNVSNVDHDKHTIGKAGRSRWKGKRPRTRGVAMNPIDHPMGGGEGKSAGGRHPVSPWGKPAKGKKTRKKKKYSNKYILKYRK